MSPLVEAQYRLTLFQSAFEYQGGIEDLHGGLILLNALSTEKDRQIGANLVLTYSKWVAGCIEGLLATGFVHRDDWQQYLTAVRDEFERSGLPLDQQFKRVWVRVAKQFLEELSPTERQQVLTELRGTS